MITVTPYGAAGEVTGSSYLVKTPRASILIDFGLFQGDKEDDARNVVPGEIHRGPLDAVLLTHAHLDHCGRLPVLVADGYRGPIFATSATRDLVELVLRDAAHIQEGDYERRLRKAKKKNIKIQRTDHPLFDTADVEAVLELIRIVEYDIEFEPASGISAVYTEAGHMLGSASISLAIVDDGIVPGEDENTVAGLEGQNIEKGSTVRHLLFSGDLGPPGLPFLRDPKPPNQTFDVIVMESTYGDRDHRSLEETVQQFGEVLVEAIRSNGKVLIPSFAIGRSQNMLYHIAELVRQRRIPRIPIYLDSPMAIEASRLYAAHQDLFDEESTELVESGAMERGLGTVRFTQTAEESKAINGKVGPFIVIAGAGMCNAGRIMHHLRNNIDDANTHVIITGYQAYGTLGRKLVEGVQHVSIMGEYKPVKAHVHTLGGFSAHAGQTHLLAWLESIVKPHSNHSTHVVLTHGEDEARDALGDVIASRLNIQTILPYYGVTMEL